MSDDPWEWKRPLKLSLLIGLMFFAVGLAGSVAVPRHAFSLFEGLTMLLGLWVAMFIYAMILENSSKL